MRATEIWGRLQRRRSPSVVGRSGRQRGNSRLEKKKKTQQAGPVRVSGQSLSFCCHQQDEPWKLILVERTRSWETSQCYTCASLKPNPRTASRIPNLSPYVSIINGSSWYMGCAGQTVWAGDTLVTRPPAGWRAACKHPRILGASSWLLGNVGRLAVV